MLKKTCAQQLILAKLLPCSDSKQSAMQNQNHFTVCESFLKQKNTCKGASFARNGCPIQGTACAWI